jgi:hypothetical protein
MFSLARTTVKWMRKGPITRIAPSGYNLIFGVGHWYDRISLGLRLNSMLAAFTV